MLYNINILAIFVDIILHNMNRKKQILFPKHQQILEQVGENIKLARKRRKLTTIQVAERAGIDRTTLYKIEKGNGSVSIAAYMNTLRVMSLQNDFLKLAGDDEFGRKLQDLSLLAIRRDKSTVPDETKLTTQAAADFLNVSRAQLVKLLEEGVIPYKSVGRHRSILLEDLIAYSAEMKQKKKEALEELARLGQQYNM